MRVQIHIYLSIFSFLNYEQEKIVLQWSNDGLDE
ncbi:MAG: hypothetical protein ACI86X_001838 [Moritella sp.]|jgi:hypothetical protein